MRQIARVWMLFVLCLAGTFQGHAQEDEIQQLLLNVEKLGQLKEMLEDMREKYQIVVQGYSKVKSMTEGNFRLHEAFMDRLVMVSPEVKSYYKVVDIIQLQIQLVKGLAHFKEEVLKIDQLNSREIGDILKIYGSFSSSSFKNLEELLMVLSDSQLQMNDGERIFSIDRIHKSMQSLISGLGRFQTSVRQVSELRKMSKNDSSSLNGLIKTD